MIRPSNANLITTVGICLVGVVLSVASYASDKPSYYRSAGASEIESVAGGFRALFTCSAYFFAGRDLDDILEIELKDSADFDLPAPTIDHRRKTVTAEGIHGATSIAVYRDSMGCTLLPPHWNEADIPRLPYVEIPRAPEVSNQPFPAGDKVDYTLTNGQEALLSRAFDSKTFGDGTITAGVIVVKDGQIVAERYGDGFGIHTGYRTWSTAKSLSATLIGIAARDGLLDIEAPAPIPEWQYKNDPRQAITLRHLMWMSSGLYSEGNNTNAVYFGGQDVVSGATGTPLETEPGERWKYANNDTLLLLRALRHVLDNDLDYLRYPYDKLFHKLGMYHTRMETDHAGNFIGSSQVYTTARDLARFGLLYLNDGMWGGERLLPEGWTEFVAEPAPARPLKDGELGYGAQFWLMGTLDGVPAGTYTSAGNKGQYSTIIPEHNMVVVRTGVDPQGIRWDHGHFIAEVVKHF